MARTTPTAPQFRSTQTKLFHATKAALDEVNAKMTVAYEGMIENTMSRRHVSLLFQKPDREQAEKMIQRTTPGYWDYWRLENDQAKLHNFFLSLDNNIIEEEVAVGEDILRIIRIHSDIRFLGIVEEST
jgi:hypothetical protein